MTLPAFRVAAVQTSAGLDKSVNFDRAERLLAQAAAQGARLAVLPEMFSCFGDWPSMIEQAEPSDGPTHQWLAAQARRHQLWLVGGSFCQRDEADARARNLCQVFAPDGSCRASYAKLHLFDAAVTTDFSTRESHWLSAGREPTIVETPLARLGVGICYDLRFSALFEHYAVEGCELIVLPAAFTRTTGRAHWETLVRARAIECQAFVIAANQVGEHAGTFGTFGHSLIVDPWGRVLADGGESPGVIVAEIDLKQVQSVRHRIPVSAHRRRIE